MKDLKTFFVAATMLLTLNPVNVEASTSYEADVCIGPLNSTFKLIIDGVDYEIATPFNLSTTPVIVQIMDKGIVVFECTAQSFFCVVSDIIEHRVHGDTIDHRVSSEGIGHRISGNSIEHAITVSQNGVVLFEAQL